MGISFLIYCGLWYRCAWVLMYLAGEGRVKAVGLLILKMAVFSFVGHTLSLGPSDSAILLWDFDFA